jgi:hypothetical protein
MSRPGAHHGQAARYPHQSHHGGIALFQRTEVRHTLHNNEWWFVIADVVAALTTLVKEPG